MNRRTIYRLTLTAAGILLVGLLRGPAAQTPPSPQQRPRPTFRANVEAVQLDLRVVDREGAFVSDLRRNEFRVFENGVEQTISNFALVEIPVEPPTLTGLTGPRADPDVATNGQPEGRLYVIVLDDLEGQAHPQRSATVRAVATEFVERNLGEHDRAALLTTSGRRDMALEFTTNRQRLLETIARFEGGYGQVAMAPTSVGGGFFDPGGGLVNDSLRNVMLSLTSLAKWLAQIDGRRKGIVFVTERLGRPMRGGFDLRLANAEASDVRDFLEAAARGNVSLYTVDPVGVPGGPAPGIRPPFIDDSTDTTPASAFDPSRQQSLITLAEATGGFATTRGNNYTASFARIVSENSSYYLLGYISTDQRRDGRFRDIQVRVTRPDLRVIARSGYVAPRDSNTRAEPTGNLPPALTDMLRSPLAVSGLPLSVAVPVLRGSGSKATVGVIVESGANRLLFTSANGRFNGGLTLAIAASDMGGKVQAGERGALSLRLSPQTRQAMLERGARVLSQLELKPGRYQLKVAAIDAADGTTKGSILHELDVPDFAKGPFSMSHLVLSATTEAPIPTVAREAKIRQRLGDAPTARRSFSRFEELRTYFEVYDNAKTGPRPVIVTTTVLDGAGSAVVARETNSQGTANSDKTTTHRIATTMGLNELAAGRYVLQVDARTAAAPEPRASRQIPFTIQ